MMDNFKEIHKEKTKINNYAKRKRLETKNMKSDMVRKIIFELSEKESKDANDWMEEHSKVCPVSYKNGNMPAAGEHYYFKIIPTGLGPCTEVGCIYCKVKKNITDYDMW